MNDSVTELPACVGIIIDGNRRWAKQHGLPTFEGHRRGYSAVRRVVQHAQRRGIKHTAVYFFSTENWNREATEVSFLMNLFRKVLTDQLSEFKSEGVRLRFAGQRERLSLDLQAMMQNAEDVTAQNDGITLWLCVSYGGRAEIVAAARAAAEEGQEITEESLAQHLWTNGMPDPDLIIRTSGEQRLSGFLSWQSVYSELFFTPTLWPDFSPEEFDAMLAEYATRERRRGK